MTNLSKGEVLGFTAILPEDFPPSCWNMENNKCSSCIVRQWSEDHLCSTFWRKAHDNVGPFFYGGKKSSVTPGSPVTLQRLVQISPLLKDFWSPLGLTCFIVHLPSVLMWCSVIVYAVLYLVQSLFASLFLGVNICMCCLCEFMCVHLCMGVFTCTCTCRGQR